MPYLLLIAGFLILTWAFYRFLKNQHIYHKRQILTVMGVLVSLLGLAYLALTGKLVWMAGVIAFWIPWAAHFIAFKNFLKRARAYQNTHKEEKKKKSSKDLSREEALDILGLSSDASEADIKKAHRRLMSRLHPDVEGSTYLASLINRAKDQLTK